jgi:hypothetical protein
MRHASACFSRARGGAARWLTLRERLLTLAAGLCAPGPQLLAPEPSAFRDMASERATLASLGVAHGSLVYFRYSVAREVTPNAVPVESRPFGAHMTIAEMVLRQTRIERQDKPRCASLSFDGQAANVFQACVPCCPAALLYPACSRAHPHPCPHRSYVSQALAFSIQRAGLLYGTCDEEGAVCAHFIYEPPQQARPLLEMQCLAHLLTWHH